MIRISPTGLTVTCTTCADTATFTERTWAAEWARTHICTLYALREKRARRTGGGAA